ncbi:integrase catalytic domain-containing protein [Deinococcus aetherius]|uniref:integrase catalytic domain-containing protein n=1 Tax=Deinococcus aetherius TaxID=200252 RepID=UPI002230B771|nr:transposase family protein [Deinococcus aetherius]
MPHLMTYSTKGGSVKRIEPRTVRVIQQELMVDPAMQLMFRDTKQRKEFLRVYNGKVHALHANAQWQMDMTRCDVEVFNPVMRRFYRLRVHAVIDVYSGCIMGLSFSEDEDQAQTNIALLRALTPKTGRYAHLYPMYGTPNTIYWDNGKTYRSGEVERIVSTLGIESIHSLPRVSHTRGAIERFFGTLHGMIERALTGYAGMNAVARDSEELRALRERTLRWAETGRDPGRQQRHLTEEEFKSVVLMWLVTEYHQMIQDTGETRQEKFLSSVQGDAARHTLRLYDPQELFMLFCRQISRVVTPDSGIQYKNRLFKSPTGALAGYAGRTVVLMEDAFSPEGWYGVVYPRKDGTYAYLGDVEPAPEWADSAESAAVRQIEKGARRALVERVEVEAERNRRPELNIAESLVRALPLSDPSQLPVVDVAPAPLPTSRARLATTPRDEDVGDFGRFLDAGKDAQTADEFMTVIKNTLPGRKK